MEKLFKLMGKFHFHFDYESYSVTVHYYNGEYREMCFDSLSSGKWHDFRTQYADHLVTQYTVDSRDDRKHIDIYLLAEENKEDHTSDEKQATSDN